MNILTYILTVWSRDGRYHDVVSFPTPQHMMNFLHHEVDTRHHVRLNVETNTGWRY